MVGIIFHSTYSFFFSDSYRKRSSDSAPIHMQMYKNLLTELVFENWSLEIA